MNKDEFIKNVSGSLISRFKILNESYNVTYIRPSNTGKICVDTDGKEIFGKLLIRHSNEPDSEAVRGLFQNIEEALEKYKVGDLFLKDVLDQITDFKNVGIG